jgi:3-hydroxyacyl-CoA dehydrogenase / 3-hydroxy-2-methylbutyryl-CoA dehydrogenase
MRAHAQMNSFKALFEFVTVNAVINCAGIGMARKTLSKSREPDTAGQLIPHSLHEFTKTLTINTVGTFNVARLAAQRMASREADCDGLRGCIINTASIAAMDGQRGQVAYAASKAALVGMTLPMARDLSSFGIRVMAIVSVCMCYDTNC